MKLPPFRLERYFARHEFTAPYLLCSSDCESWSIGDVLALEDGAAERFGALRLGYTEYIGHPELRQTIAGLYKHATPDQILVHAGAEEAIFNFMNVALSPGDHVVVHAPCYQSLGEVARAIGAEVSPWTGDPSRGWALELSELEALVSDRTRVVVVNFPHNPTGFLPDEGFVRELSRLSDQLGFLVLSDEVYRGLEGDEADRLPSFADLNERAVSLGVMSKTYGLAGLRIGWIATRNGPMLEALASFKDYTSICNSAPSEFLATVALRHHEAVAGRNRAIIRSNLDLLDDFFGANGNVFQWHRPRGGSVAFPMLLEGQVESFCSDLVQESGVLLLPGTLYGSPSNCFRIGFGRQNMPEALDRLSRHLASRTASG